MPRSNRPQKACEEAIVAYKKSVAKVFSWKILRVDALAKTFDLYFRIKHHDIVASITEWHWITNSVLKLN